MILTKIKESKIIAIIRLKDSSEIFNIFNALIKGGLSCLELTMNTPNILSKLKKIRKEFNNITLGMGTVLKIEDAKKLIDMGIEYIVSPILNSEIGKLCLNKNIPYIPGVLTPNEIYSAMQITNIVKLFPANVVGPGYLKNIHDVFPDIKIVPTGGIDLTNINNYFEKGAYAVGIGTNLVSKKAVEEKNWKEIENTARKYINTVNLKL